jgi:ABC-type phosphate transport system auxiliary subunit
VSCDELYQYLEEAETIAKIAKSTKLERNLRLKKRRRTQTLEEQLDDRNEDAYTEHEGHISKHRDLDNASYKESSLKCT